MEACYLSKTYFLLLHTTTGIMYCYLDNKI